MPAAIHTILAEQTVSITELRKNPAQYFQEEPIAVLSNNAPKGYMVSTALFEKMVDALERQQQEVKASFRPSASRLQTIAEQGEQLLQQADEQALSEFTEI